MLEKQWWIHYAPEMMTEWRQLWEEGKDVSSFKDACEAIVKKAKAQNCEEEAILLFEAMQAAPMRESYAYQEPSAYEEILSLLPDEQPVQELPATEILRDRIAGAWIGRIAGCLLGKPLEGLRMNTLLPILQCTGNYPMNRYVDSREFTDELRGKVDFNALDSWQKCWVDTIGDAAPSDDDTNYTVFALKLVETYGRRFRPNDVLEGWLQWIPMFATCTAERVAYRNAAMGLYAPETAVRRNPYREWIGAQIRGDFYGYINPGRSREAARMAWNDASISHVKNGIYGEMFVAAMIAQAAVCSDRLSLVRAGLAEIPASSRLAAEIRQVIAWYEEGKTWSNVSDAIHHRYDEWSQHDWCHTNSNAMIVAAALLYGGGDFGKTICLAVQTGFDTDCNGATVGSIVGMILGEKAIPAVWADAFHHTLRTSIDGYQRVTIGELTEKTLKLMDV